ncbi:MAG: hypothetical protein Sv326_0999 [Candidatus Fermentimicrarchaeum limneticum]|uniref:Uncharacterized protein n=1 Tax=Fermentimicrarchaeum limneticum TaxID=2795018 RepID=A0A7D5XIG2_FERL1|nr:MAG: hypothetical protein Sv326_0999 [Candidatus Fermentimicrarchaeum limneticum]
MMEHKKEKHVSEGGSQSFFGDPWKIFLSLVVVILLAYIALNSKPPQTNGGNDQNGTVQPTTQANATIELFVMSQCPYGVEAETLAKSVIDNFNGEVNLSVRFIAGENADGSFTSLHGANEVAEDLRQVCIMEYYPTAYVNYLSCISANYQTVGQVWEGCASQNNIDVNKIKGCSTGDEGKALLSENIKKAKNLGIGTSPTIYLNGQPYSGGRDESSMTRAVCTSIPDSNVCKNLPPEIGVELTVVNDDDCLLCDPSGIESSIRSLISNLSVREVNYTSSEGAALIQEFNITGVPAYIFGPTIAQHGSYETLSRYLYKVDSDYLLIVQPVKILGRSEENDTLMLFVMSQCPYGTMAETAMKELLEALPDVKFAGLYFIAGENADGSFTSLHGANEVAEDLRQVCIMEYYPAKIMNYTRCIAANYSNAGSIWQNCASSNSIDSTKISNCSTGNEGKALLSENIKLGESLGIGSSPTMMLNNNTLFSTIYADQIKQVICAYDPELNGCNKTLSGAGSTTPSGGCG